MNFELFKKRDFGSLIADTFEFLKSEFRSYFKHFLAINGMLMLLLLLIAYPFIDLLFSSLSVGPDVDALFMRMMNSVWMIPLLILAFLVYLAIAMVQFVYPSLYMRHMAHEQTPLTTKVMVNLMVSALGRLILFTMVSGLAMLIIMFLMVVLIIQSGVVSTAVAILLLFPAMLFLAPTFFIYLYLSLYFYMEPQASLFASFGLAWKALMANFWSFWGSTVVMFFIYMILHIGFSFFVQMLIALGIGVGGVNPDFPPVVILISTVITALISMFFYMISIQLLQVNIGMMYYSQLDSDQSLNDLKAIEMIGDAE